MRYLELLAPARNADIGIAAIDCGADAVYIGAPSFGARQAAGNSVEDIARLCSHAHIFGARVFVTLNTILYDSELPEARRLLLEVQDAGADAVIVQDMAFAQMLRSDGGSIRIPLHASTQCAIRTPEKAQWLEQAGFSRLILERQLSLKQIRAIAESVDCEIECFVHGANCVCYSGECYLSEMIAGRSANRGECIQACRSRYDLVDGEGTVLARNKTLLSLKDLNLSESLAELIDAGVTSFKIEGRLKNESYVKNAVRKYAIALDRIVEQSGGRLARASFGRVEGGFTPDDTKTFNRGYTSLFIDGQRGQWSTMDAAKSMGEELGTVTRLNAGHTEFTLNASHADPLHNGDGLAFVSRDGEVVGMRADVVNGCSIRCKPTPELYEGARIWRNLDMAFEKSLEARPCRRLIGVSLQVEASPSSLKVSAVSEDGRTAFVEIPAVEPAGNQERMRTLLSQQLSKTAGYFSFSVSSDIPDNGRLPLLPASAINALRRDLADRLGAMPCNSIPLYKADGFPVRGQWAPVTDYHANISNSLAEEFYREYAGAEKAERAYELTHSPGIELMRTKYCIRHELGLCPRRSHQHNSSPLFLVNNGRRLRLGFDCARCEMTVESL